LVIDLVQEGVAWFYELGSTPLSIPVTVAQSAAYRVTWGSSSGPGALTPGSLGTVVVNATNTGTMPWLAADPTHPVHLTYYWLNSQGSVVAWNGLRTSLPHDVPVGGPINSVSMAIQAPDDP